VLSTAPLTTVYEFLPSPVKEVFSYSKAVQTTEEWGTQTSRPKVFEDSEEDEGETAATSTPNKRLSRRERTREDELRENIRKEIEEELKATRDLVGDGPLRIAPQSSTANFPARILTNEELNAVTSSEDFMEFVERSSKVIERALDQEYDILADYALSGVNGVGDDDDEYGNTRGGVRRRV
jgi:dynein intermediate chain